MVFKSKLYQCIQYFLFYVVLPGDPRPAISIMFSNIRDLAE